MRRLATLALPALLLVLCGTAPALAQNAFVARADRSSATIGDEVIYEVTLSLSDGRVQSYRAPDFRGFRVLGEYPSQSTQISMGGGRSVMRTVYTWRYELSPTESGRLTIAPARAKVGGKELRTGSVSLSVASGALSPPGKSADATAPGRRPGRVTAPPSRRPRFRSPFDDIFGLDDPAPPPPAATAPGGEVLFIRAVADKTRVYQGEQVLVEWLLYASRMPDRYKAAVEPRIDGFWSEDLLLPGSGAGGLPVTQQLFDGQMVAVAKLSRKALFPLQSGTLTITPMEAEVFRLDFFGREVQARRLKADPLAIEVLPLPAAGQPANFDPAAVGRFSLEAKLDRTTLAVGEAVTLKLVVTGAGNLRKLSPPALPAELSNGWRAYEPKMDVKVENSDSITGVKTVEYLLLAQRPGVTQLPALSLPYFDPGARRYEVARSAPLRIEVAGDARTAAGKGAPGSAAAQALENVLPSEIRPPRTGASLSRDLGTTFYQSRLFWLVVLLPPLAFAGTAIADRIRARMSKDTESGRRRKSRRLARQHLRAAESELERGNPGAFFVEIDRVLRGALGARLGRPVAGLSRDELRRELGATGLPDSVAERVLEQLEACDRGRFAPGSASLPDLRATLERAEELIGLIEKAPARSTAPAGRARA